MNGTYAENYTKLNKLTLEDLKKCALTHYKIPSLPKNRKIGWFEKLMNKFGWYKQCEMIIIDKAAFDYYPQYKPVLPEVKG